MNLPHALSATIKKISGDTAILETKKGMTIEWPINLLSRPAKIGENVRLVAMLEKDSEQERSQFARQILNEMLGGSSD